MPDPTVVPALIDGAGGGAIGAAIVGVVTVKMLFDRVWPTKGRDTPGQLTCPVRDDHETKGLLRQMLQNLEKISSSQERATEAAMRAGSEHELMVQRLGDIAARLR